MLLYFFQIIIMSSKAIRPPGKLDGGMKAANLLTDADIEALLGKLSSEEIELLAGGRDRARLHVTWRQLDLWT